MFFCLAIIAFQPLGPVLPDGTVNRRAFARASADAYDACIAMKVSELKAELDLRSISYADLFEKEELARRLAQAREKGEASPDLIDEFNKQSAEQAWGADGGAEGEQSGVPMDEVVAGDGSLPGGSSPEAVEALKQNPELMALLRNTKMQEVMKKVMEGGPEAAAQYMDDPDVREMLSKFKGLTGPP